MPRERTPSQVQPNGWEKCTHRIEVGCTATEKLFWQAVFGNGSLSDQARILLNREACRKAHIPASKHSPG